MGRAARVMILRFSASPDVACCIDHGQYSWIQPAAASSLMFVSASRVRLAMACRCAVVYSRRANVVIPSPALMLLCILQSFGHPLIRR